MVSAGLINRVGKLESLLKQQAQARQALEDAKKADPARVVQAELERLEAEILAARAEEVKQNAAARQKTLDDIEAQARKAAPKALAQLELIAAECEQLQVAFDRAAPRLNTPEAEMCTGSRAREAVLELGLIGAAARGGVERYTHHRRLVASLERQRRGER